jgi:hypothetical protein
MLKRRLHCWMTAALLVGAACSHAHSGGSAVSSVRAPTPRVSILRAVEPLRVPIVEASLSVVCDTDRATRLQVLATCFREAVSSLRSEPQGLSDLEPFFSRWLVRDSENVPAECDILRKHVEPPPYAVQPVFEIARTTDDVFPCFTNAHAYHFRCPEDPETAGVLIGTITCDQYGQ